MTYQKPYTFKPGNYAKASEVNANFDTMKDFVDDLQNTISINEVQSVPYSKANREGDSTVVFNVATSTNTNAAVNNARLESAISEVDTTVSTIASTVSTIQSDVSNLETSIQNITIAPDYTTNTAIPAESGTFASGGLLYLTNGDSSSHTVTLGSYTFAIRANSNVTFPVRQGGTYNLSNFTGNVTRVLFTYGG